MASEFLAAPECGANGHVPDRSTALSPTCGQCPVSHEDLAGSTPIATERPLILGVGNLLVGDEGVGVAAVQHLEAAGFAAYAELVDGGTSGFHLLGLFRNRPHIILIDATADGQPPGTVSHLRPRFASDYPATLTAHDIGLKDLIESAALLGDSPPVDLITISISALHGLSVELSPAVAAALCRVEELTTRLLRPGSPPGSGLKS